MVTRRLVAVLCADVAGFSRLAERDETRTHDRLAEIRAGVFEPAVATHGGRVVKTMGDGLLVEFASATAAVRCAVDVQHAMAQRNAAFPEDDRIVFRIGINLGDIIVDGDDIFGDGVNVASRLEGLADPGAVAVSATLWEQVREDVGVDAIDGGEVHVKSIERPLHVFHLVPRVRGSNVAAGHVGRPRIAPSLRRPLLVAAAAISVAVTGIAGYREFLARTANEARSTATAPARSMVILPFSAVGGGSESAALAAGLSSEFARLIAAGMRDWRVAEPPATQGADARDVARAANVRYVIAGELQRVEGGTSLTVRVVDGAEARRIATEQRNLPSGDAGARQGAVLADIVRGVRVALDDEEARRDKAPERPKTAADYVARARVQLAAATGANTSPLQGALRDLDEAIRRDPSLAEAWIRKSEALWFVRGFQYTEDVDPIALARAMDETSLRAVELDPRNPRAWSARMTALEALGRWDAAFDASDRAMQLDSADGVLVQERALLLVFVGRADEAMSYVTEQRARDPSLARYTRFIECRALLTAGRYADAIPVCERNASASSYIEQMFVTALYANTGDVGRAQAARARLMELAPGFTIGKFKTRAPSHPEFVRQLEEHVFPGLRKVGVPD
jgi:adenylate cyclase